MGMYKYALLSFVTIFFLSTCISNADNVNFKVLDEVLSITNKYYIQNIDKNKSEEAMINGLITSLDPHSTYINKIQLQKIHESMRDSYSGIGIEITKLNKDLIISDVYIDSPAAKAGIKPRDIITEVNGRKLVSITMDEIRNIVIGEIGSPLDITVMRNDTELKFKVKRVKIKILNTQVNLIDSGKIAYIRIKNFGKNVAKKIKQAYSELNKVNLCGVIIDVRANPGGLMDEAIDVASLFLPKAMKVVSIRSKNQKASQEFLSDGEDITDNLPIVVMINSISASAAEIVASALQDNKRAQILGTKSFGKGSIQTMFNLSNGDAIKITTALYYTPNGKVMQGNGVDPDVIVADGMVIQDILFPVNFAEKNLQNSLPANLFAKDIQINTEKARQLYNSKVLGDAMSDFQLMRAIDLIKTMSYYKSLNKIN